MIRLLENGKLKSDLDFDGFFLKNSGDFDPVPVDITGTNDPRMTDARNVPAGSVTDDSVNAAAGIQQSKLNLNGNIPPAWLGTGANQAAQGDLVEMASRKGVANGYAGMDANGRILLANMPSTGPGAGTVTSVTLEMRPELKVSPEPPVLTVAGTFTCTWPIEPDNSYLGVNGKIGFDPQFLPSLLTTVLPMELVPDLPASKFPSGIFPRIFPVARLPFVTPLGVGHAKGILTDPGVAVGDPSDYFGRDAQWHQVKIVKVPQPTLPKVEITFISISGGMAKIRLSAIKGALIFYLLRDLNAAPIVEPYQETKNPSIILVSENFIISAYAAKAGYNNSDINQFTVPVT